MSICFEAKQLHIHIHLIIQQDVYAAQQRVDCQIRQTIGAWHQCGKPTVNLTKEELININSVC